MNNHVSLEQKVCPICGKLTDAGILLASKYKEDDNGTIEPVHPLSPTTVTGFGVCEEHQKQIDNGWVFLIEVENERNEDTLGMDDAVRTGRVLSIHKTAFVKIFDTELPEDSIGFITKDGFEKIEEMMPKEDDDDQCPDQHSS